MTPHRVLLPLVATLALATTACTAEPTPPQPQAAIRSISLPGAHPTWNAAGAAVGDKLVVWGGLSGFAKDPKPHAGGWIVDISTASQTATSSSPLAARSHHLAVVHNELVYLWGGNDGDGKLLADGAVLDPVRNTWKKLPAAPLGLESAQAVVHHNHILISGGLKDANQSNDTMLDYDITNQSWSSTKLSQPVTGWTIINDKIVTVSRMADARSLQVSWLDVQTKHERANKTVEPKLALADYVGIARQGDDAVIAASDRNVTELFQITPDRAVSRQSSLNATQFAPATRVPTASGMSFQSNDLWISLEERDIKTLSTSQWTSTGTWRLDTCRDNALWIATGARSFARYGGLPCGGDATNRLDSLLSLVDL